MENRIKVRLPSQTISHLEASAEDDRKENPASTLYQSFRTGKSIKVGRGYVFEVELNTTDARYMEKSMREYGEVLIMQDDFDGVRQEGRALIEGAKRINYALDGQA